MATRAVQTQRGMGFVGKLPLLSRQEKAEQDDRQPLHNSLVTNLGETDQVRSNDLPNRQ